MDKRTLEMFMGAGLLLAAAVLVYLVLLIPNAFIGEWEHSEATVIGKGYTPSQTTTGVGPVIGGKGEVAVTMSTTSEEWSMVVKREGGEVVAIKTNAQRWAEAKDGDAVKLRRWVGFMQAWSWGLDSEY